MVSLCMISVKEKTYLPNKISVVPLTLAPSEKNLAQGNLSLNREPNSVTSAFLKIVKIDQLLSVREYSKVILYKSLRLL